MTMLRFFECVHQYSFLTIPSAPIITGILVVFGCHVIAVSISRSLYFQSLSNYFAGVFLSE